MDIDLEGLYEWCTVTYRYVLELEADKKASERRHHGQRDKATQGGKKEGVGEPPEEDDKLKRGSSVVRAAPAIVTTVSGGPQILYWNRTGKFASGAREETLWLQRTRPQFCMIQLTSRWKRQQPPKKHGQSLYGSRGIRTPAEDLKGLKRREWIVHGDPQIRIAVHLRLNETLEVKVQC
ncbi:hypothetical protein B0H19DRAFT_1086045 [Mycena capillaripes]|nr:hypothetical protein B0H19DRAFT_1086045 [Mycena capillaripes]